MKAATYLIPCGLFLLFVSGAFYSYADKTPGRHVREIFYSPYYVMTLENK